MRSRQSALMCTVPMDYAIDAPVNHGDRLRVEITDKATGQKRMAVLRRALLGETALLTDVEGHGWIEEGSKS